MKGIQIKRGTRIRRIFLFMIALLILSSCTSGKKTYLKMDYAHFLNLEPQKQTRILISQEDIDDRFVIREKTYVSDLDRKWNHTNINPKEIYLSVLSEAFGSLYSIDVQYDFLLVPKMNNFRYRLLNTSRNSLEYGKQYCNKYKSEFTIQLTIFDVNRNEINRDTYDVESISEGCDFVAKNIVSSNATDWAKASAIKNGIEKSIVDAISSKLPDLIKVFYDKSSK